MGKCDTLKRRFYAPACQKNSSLFLEMIDRCVSRGLVVLDLGAGTGRKFKYELKSKVEPEGEVVGADFDNRVRENPLVHRGVVLDGPQLPFPDATFDVVFCRSVLEHVADPAAFLREVGRVLKPNSSFLFLTPNRRHYACLAARCTPLWFHTWYNKRLGRDEADTFPTVYRLNTRSAIRRHLREAGFVEKELRMCECCPNYLTVAAPLFLMGVAYERLVNASDVLSGLRAGILGHFVKAMSRSGT